MPAFRPRKIVVPRPLDDLAALLPGDLALSLEPVSALRRTLSSESASTSARRTIIATVRRTRWLVWDWFVFGWLVIGPQRGMLPAFCRFVRTPAATKSRWAAG
jgi:hypothetical protein